MSDRTETTVAGIHFSNDGNIRSLDSVDCPVFVHKEENSSYHTLQQLALAVSCHRPVLLCGPVGSGKTAAVEHLAWRMGFTSPSILKSDVNSIPLFLKVQLGEQTDSRMLLGGYQCTEIPGQFIWKPGVLTQAVLKGHWLLLEDFDCTSSDLLTVIENLVKTQCLCIPGYSDNIIPHERFQLFATQRTHGCELLSSLKNSKSKQWCIIQLKPLTKSNIIAIITEKFPQLASIAHRLVSVLDIDFPKNYCKNARAPSVRDILKWCNRCVKYFQAGNVESSLRIFQDAVDIFCGFMEKNLRYNIACQIGVCLGIVENRANFLNKTYKPFVLISEKELVAGRARLQKSSNDIALISSMKRNIFSLNIHTCSLIEKIGCSLENNEPVLLVGETGCGKTSVLQYIADTLGKRLIVINMSQQSDTADLIGGFKPVSIKRIMKPFLEYFEQLFRDLFIPEKNVDCLNKFFRLIQKEKWEILINFIAHVQKRALSQIDSRLKVYEESENENSDFKKWENRRLKWQELGSLIEKYSKQKSAAEKSLLFSFVEGSLVNAIKNGDWVLLDEINLANSETLDCLNGLLENSHESILLLEKGECMPIVRNSDFRLFAAMNPATDVGKRQLPLGVRSRFTEFYIDELDDPHDLRFLIETYLCDLNRDPGKLKKIAEFYLNVKNLSNNGVLRGNEKKPHFSLRNLCRALSMTSRNFCGSFSRSLYESLNVSFLTQLDSNSYKTVEELIVQAVVENNAKTLLNQPIPKPEIGHHVQLEGFWLPVGCLPLTKPDDYIITPTVRRHYRDLIKIVSLGSGIPILLEGDTSVGKTSLINYLAKCTGTVCSRVNNHEHTDIQEYIGTYVADSKGKLVFKEGILCEAMRKGHWLILDELNLAPTDVLEALNRVLDDNRELFIPETQTKIKAHRLFLLFATQNPTGVYGGRKELSRAFRNRFIELHFNQIPPDELITILEKRCLLPKSYCKKMVGVMVDLQLRRRGSDIFTGKYGFITLRDLFRWGERYRKAKIDSSFHEWEKHIADEGFMLLAGKVRLAEECKIIEDVIAKYFKHRPNANNIFSLHENTSPASRHILVELKKFSDNDEEFSHIAWTYNMRRLAVLVYKALDFFEPVLIIGETGGGKTSIVQILAKLHKQKLFSLNCHMHSESGDFLGGLRPVRDDSRASGKLFEWCDGPLLIAMKTGSFFLADEISLADDSVLERLNSLLEPERTILLAEKGSEILESENYADGVIAHENFRFFGTMNPGGDYGKKELSPALRNRFTEIWADVTFNKYDCFLEIIRHNLNVPEMFRVRLSDVMIDFLKWFQLSEIGKKYTVSNRDVMTWINFMNSTRLDIWESFVHGIFLTFLDGIGCGSHFGCSDASLNKFKQRCLDYLIKKFEASFPDLNSQLHAIIDRDDPLSVENDKIGISPFYIRKGKGNSSTDKHIFKTPTTLANLKKLLRALQISKAILLEGSPGVGKTSLVSSLAKISGHEIVRINFSDQTDLSDLFGADLPEEGGAAGRFAWKDGPLLSALKKGHWILLDELNLASQSVLEGLNAILDHRESVYLPELNKVFQVSRDTRLFGCQNPLKEGGNRRGLPRSFLNRFTQVYIEPMTNFDYAVILNDTFPMLSGIKIKGESLANQIINFTSAIREGISKGLIGNHGGPWEFNLRDIMRWAEGLTKDLNLSRPNADVKVIENMSSGDKSILHRFIFKQVNVVYMSRFRSDFDRKWVQKLFVSFFGGTDAFNEKPTVYITNDIIIMGDNATTINNLFFYGDIDEFKIFVNAKKQNHVQKKILGICSSYHGKRKLDKLRLLEKQFPLLCSLCHCVNMNWLPILVGESGSGKTNCIRTLAALKRENLKVISCNAAMDATEILGGFEQTDINRNIERISERAKIILLSASKRFLEQGLAEDCLFFLQKWTEYQNFSARDDSFSTSDLYKFYQKKIDLLSALLKHESLKNSDELKDISRELVFQLETLKGTLSAEECSSSGGKFEWVDSILVKALKDGSWLLMEDVNLCSNAVLDRLNALLEPDGRLIIGERGTDANSELVSVTPHRNFRLFFTMDPANGTISRAMRNRGIEINVHLDNEVRSWPQLDLISLLSDSGVADEEMQKALIDMDSRAENPSICNIISNGFWTSQYVTCGFTRAEALKKSSERIYKFSDGKEPIVVPMVERGSKLKKIDVSFARPDLEVYIENSRNAALKISSALILFISEIMCDGSNLNDQLPSSVTSWFFGQTELLFDQKISLVSLARYNVLHIYMSASAEVGVSFKNFVDGIISPSNSALRKTVSEDASLYEKAVPDASPLRHLPWDRRWFENIHVLYGGELDANRRLLLMKFLFSRSPETDSHAPNGCTTVEKYSKAFQRGHSEDFFPDRPFVSRFHEFSKGFDLFIFETLKDNNFQVCDDETSWLLNAMKWKIRLEKQGKLPLFQDERKRTIEEDNLLLLELHFAWFCKAFATEDDGSVSGSNQMRLQVSRHIRNSLSSFTLHFTAHKLIKFCNAFRKLLGHPSPESHRTPETSPKEEENRMDVDEQPQSFSQDNLPFDPAIARSILIDFVECLNSSLYIDRIFNGILYSNSMRKMLRHLSAIGDEGKNFWTLKNIIEKISGSNEMERRKLVPEFTYVSFKVINNDYLFEEEVDEHWRRIYFNQVLPIHRPVWTCRIVGKVFNLDETLSLTENARHQNELKRLKLTLFPNAVFARDQTGGPFLFDPARNEEERLNQKAHRVMDALKIVLNADAESPECLATALTQLMAKTEDSGEKNFYRRLKETMEALAATFTLERHYSLEILLGCGWSLLGLLELLVFREGKIDPIRKKLLKAEYAKTEFEEVRSELLALELHSRVTGISLNHIYVLCLKNRLKASKEKQTKHEHLERIDRTTVAFREIMGEVESLMTVFNEIHSFCRKVMETTNAPDIRAEHYFRKGKYILMRIKGIRERLEKRVGHFEDLTYPILAALSQVEHGMNFILSELLRLPFSRSEEIEWFVEKLGQYPADLNADFLSDAAKLKPAMWPPQAFSALQEHKLLILFSSYILLYNKWWYFRKDEPLLCLINAFSSIVGIWKAEQRKIEEKLIERESLYLKKGAEKCKTLTEEEELSDEVSKLFPTFEEDFSEKSEICTESNVDVEKMDEDHLMEISQLHMNLMKVGSRVRWNNSADATSSRIPAPDHVTPLCLRFLFLSKILPHVSFILKKSTDRKLVPGLLLLLHAKESGLVPSNADSLFGSSSTMYDFYRDKNVEEVQKCLGVLSDFKGKLSELLNEWPDNPTLIQISKIVDRILGFSVESPVMRFLTGLELLLKNCNDWECVASSKVTLADHLAQITALVIAWRKLELQGWKNCLAAAHERMKKKAKKWWFHFWCIIEDYFNKSESESESYFHDLLKSIYNFVELSPAGEFETRLDIIISYHYHLLYLPESSKRDNLCVALWNVHSFYQQYKEEVAKKLQCDSAPIFKKLREFVKIAKWHDITFWSVKRAVEKTHRTLIKCIKEYEALLKERIDLASFDVKTDHSLKTFTKSKTAFVRNESRKLLQAQKLFSLNNLKKKLDKALKFSRKIIIADKYWLLTKVINNITDSLRSSMNYFNSLKVDEKLPLAKRKSQAKNIVQQKRRALADLFKILQRIGVSYRAGLMEHPFGVLDLCDAPPMSHVSDGSRSRRGEIYYLKCISRNLHLMNALLNPSKEIGSATALRLKGFARHIMEINRKQRLSLIKSSVLFDRLKQFQTVFNSLAADNGQTFVLVNQKKFIKKMNMLKKELSYGCYRIDEFKCLLDSWPETGEEVMRDCSCFGEDAIPRVFTSSQTSDVYIALRKRFDEIHSNFTKLKMKFESDFPAKVTYYAVRSMGANKIFINDFEFYTSDDVAAYNESLSEYKDLLRDLKDFSAGFRSASLKCNLIDGLNEFGELGESDIYCPDDRGLRGYEKVVFQENLVRLTEKLISTILLGIQNIIKNNEITLESSNEDNNVSSDPTEEEEISQLMENHLSEKLAGALSFDLVHLNMEEVNNVLTEIFQQITEFTAASDLTSQTDDIYSILWTAGLFLQEFCRLCAYHVDSQAHSYEVSGEFASAVLKTFALVAQKGYCAPPEYEENEDEKEISESKIDEGPGGFTGSDAQGGKDVSSKIENEDELEDAAPKRFEKEDEEDRDCQEEESGIEISENFEGKAQDINNSEGSEKEDADEKEDDADLDMEMGETKKGAEKLESEMWSDSDEDSDKEEDNEFGEGGKGEEINQNKYSSSKELENDQKEEGNDKKRKNREKEKILNENEEPEEFSEQSDPYHGRHHTDPETEPLDLPDDMQLDDGEAKENENDLEENPFDVDSMKQRREQQQEFINHTPDDEAGNISEADADSMSSNEEEADGMKEKDDDHNDEGEHEDRVSDCAVTEEGINEASETEAGEEDKTSADKNDSQHGKPGETVVAQSAPQMNDRKNGSHDQVAGNDENEAKDFRPQETCEKIESESSGVGQAEMQETQWGHDADVAKNKKFKSGESGDSRRERKRERPGKSSDERCLGDEQGRFNKKSKTVDEVGDPEKTSEENFREEKSDLYQHITEDVKEAIQVLDAATANQSENQSVFENFEEIQEENKGLGLDDLEEEEMLVDEDDNLRTANNFDDAKSSKVADSLKTHGKADKEMKEVAIEEGKDEVVKTSNVERGPETTFSTNLMVLEAMEEWNGETDDADPFERKAKKQVSSDRDDHPEEKNSTSVENVAAWQLLVSTVEESARNLSEQLRIILEPTLATRLKGDYRTGRRINMKKVIGYIASEFRKDNIWLRRTKPWQREHEIIIALDDSHSMRHNESWEMALESVALVWRALDIVEGGRLGVLSFGENAKIVHGLGEPFSVGVGAKLVRDFTFLQKKTMICEMLELSAAMMKNGKRGNDVAQLLLIISDGRGVFSEGFYKVKKAVSKAANSGIFLVFIIIDNPKSRDSIMDIRMPEFKNGEFVGMKPYMESFPFPFYLINRDIRMLPMTLSDALRQWFQLINSKNSE